MRLGQLLAILWLAPLPSFSQAPAPASAPSPLTQPPKDPLAELRKNSAKLTEKKFDLLSDKSLSEHGKLALAQTKEWRHGETEHFVIHFLRLTEAERLARETEFFYAKIKLDLVPAKDLARGKSHVFLFDREEDWSKFRERSRIPSWSAGVTMGDEFFLAALPGDAQKIAQAEHIMAHELTHLILNRFLAKPLPLWLNEGFAEYQADDAYRKLKGLGPLPAAAPPAHKMAVAELTGLTAYPTDPEKVRDFYDESARLVRFLLEKHDKKHFVSFLYTMISGETFEHGIARDYSSKYKKFSDFEKAYK